MKQFTALAIISILAIGCSSTSTSLDFAAPAKATMPIFAVSQTQASILQKILGMLENRAMAADSWANGNFFYEVWYAFADSSLPNPYNGGMWGSENLLWNIDQANNCSKNLTCMNALNRSITGPLTMGSDNYVCGFISDSGDTKVAYSASGTIPDAGTGTASAEVIKALITFHSSNNDFHSDGQLVMMGSYNKVTGDLTLKVASYGDEPSLNNVFSVRMDVVGNAFTHAFTLYYSKRNSPMQVNGYYTNNLDLVGKGVSQGAGKYFLVKVQDTYGKRQFGPNAGMGPAGGEYYCYPAGAGDAELRGLTEDANTTTSTANISPNCASYVTDVAAMNFLTEADIPLLPMNIDIF